MTEEMETSSANLLYMPCDMLNKIFSYVDHKSRMRLRKTCKRASVVIDNMPLHFNGVQIDLSNKWCQLTYTYPDNYYRAIYYGEKDDGCEIGPPPHERGSTRQFYPGDNFLDCFALDLKAFASNSSMTITNFVVNSMLYSEAGFQTIRDTVLRVFNSLNNRIQAKNITVGFVGGQEDVMLSVPFLDPAYLDYIQLCYADQFRAIPIDRVLATEQFARTNKFITNGFSVNMTVAQICSVPLIEVSFHSFPPRLEQRILENYRNSPTLKTCFIGSQTGYSERVEPRYHEYVHQNEVTTGKRIKDTSGSEFINLKPVDA